MKVRRHVLELIKSGVLKEGDRLPTEAALASEFNTTRSTIVHALKELVYSGTIERQAGKGTFVASCNFDTPLSVRGIKSLEEQWQSSGKKISYEILSARKIPASSALASEMNMKIGASLFEIERLRLADGIPMSIEKRFISNMYAENLTLSHLEATSFMAMVQEVVGLHIERISGFIEAVAADQRSAKILGIRCGDPLIVRDYTYYSTSGSPVSRGISYFRNEVRFAYETGERTIEM
ncbi:GntR family transcriptional regulator [Salipiger profundus]|uniref:GntR family transcriptional regulator n=1 Tax=Salipiger profundus TaxID=1229727 RepID=UPI0013F4D868|nr:GntR family transcriptional regulator [Salipiger profundus]